MIKKEDISRAVKMFKEWDNERMWKVPAEAFTHHTLKKSENALRTAKFILKIMEEPKAREFFEAVMCKIWIESRSYRLR